MTFRFESSSHRYFVNGQERPHLTGLLKAAGLVNDAFYTEESRIRGDAVHRLTSDYDLDALDPSTLVSPYRGYLLGFVAAMRVIPHEWQRIEEPRMHPHYLYGYRTDRVGLIYRIQGVLEIKTTAAPCHAHEIQTALQVMGDSYEHPIPREDWWRGALYLKPDGKWKLIEHTHRRDFDDADRILAQFCPPPCPLPAETLTESRRRAVSDRRGSDRPGTAVANRRAASRRSA